MLADWLARVHPVVITFSLFQQAAGARTVSCRAWQEVTLERLVLLLLSAKVARVLALARADLNLAASQPACKQAR